MSNNVKNSDSDNLTKEGNVDEVVIISSEDESDDCDSVSKNEPINRSKVSTVQCRKEVFISNRTSKNDYLKTNARSANPTINFNFNRLLSNSNIYSLVQNSKVPSQPGSDGNSAFTVKSNLPEITSSTLQDKSKEIDWNTLTLSSLLKSSGNSLKAPAEHIESSMTNRNEKKEQAPMVPQVGAASQPKLVISHFSNTGTSFVPVVTQCQPVISVPPVTQGQFTFNIQNTQSSPVVPPSLAIRIQLPSTVPASQNNVHLPFNVAQSSIQNPVPPPIHSNLVILPSLPNNSLANPSVLPPAFNSLSKNHSVVPFILNSNTFPSSNLLTQPPVTSMQNATTNIQPQMIVMQLGPENVAQVSSSTSKAVGIMNYTEQVMNVGPSLQQPSVSLLPSSMCYNNFTTSSKQVDTLVPTEDGTIKGNLIVKSVNRVEQTAILMSQGSNSNNLLQCQTSSVLLPSKTFPSHLTNLQLLVKTNPTVSKPPNVSQTTLIPCLNKSTSVPPWHTKSSSQNDLRKVEVCQSNQTNHDKKIPSTKVNVVQPLVQVKPQPLQYLNNRSPIKFCSPSDPKVLCEMSSHLYPKPLEKNSNKNEINDQKNSVNLCDSVIERTNPKLYPTVLSNTSEIKPSTSTCSQPSSEEESKLKSHDKSLWGPAGNETLPKIFNTQKSLYASNEVRNTEENEVRNTEENKVRNTEESEVIFIDDSSDEDENSILLLKDSALQSDPSLKHTISQHLPGDSAMLEKTLPFQTNEIAPVNIKKDSNNTIKINIDRSSTLNQPFSLSGVEVNIQNSSIEPDFTASNSDVENDCNDKTVVANNLLFKNECDDKTEMSCNITETPTDYRTIDKDDKEVFLFQMECDDSSDETYDLNIANSKLKYDNSDCKSEQFAVSPFKSGLENNYISEEAFDKKSSKFEMECDDSLSGMNSVESDFEVEETKLDTRLSDNENISKKLFSKDADQISDEKSEREILLVDEKPYICSFCGFGVATEGNLLIHVNAFHSDKNYEHNTVTETKERPTGKNLSDSSVQVKSKCPTCDFQTPDFLSLNNHLQSAHKSFLFSKSNVLMFLEDNVKDLKTHEGILKKNVRCELCDTMVASSEFSSHLLVQHPVNFRFKCSSCEFKANSGWQMRNHSCDNFSGNENPARTTRCNPYEIYNVAKEGACNKPRLRSNKRCSFHCKQCDFRASSESSLTDHHKLNHCLQELLHCSYCSFETEGKLDLIKHKHKTHPDKYPFLCHICQLRFCKKTNFQRHCEIHGNNQHQSEDLSDNKLIPCKNCDFETDNTEFMVKHCQLNHDTKLHTTENLFPVFEVDSVATSIVFPNDTGNVNMSKCDTSLAKYQCQYCKFICENKSSLRIHKYRLHADKLPYSCKLCIFKSQLASNLKRHERTVHKLKRKHYNLYSCKLCPFKTSEMALLTKHKKNVHWARYRFKCPSCSYRTCIKSDFNMHLINVHSNTTRMVHKNSRYSRQITTPRVMIGLTSEEESDLSFYHCPKCVFKIKDQSKFEIHMINVHDKCMKCPSCPTFVSSVNQFFIHCNENHPSMFPYKCPFCCFCSSNREEVVCHKKLLHKPLFCYYCKYSISSVDMMNSHILKCHPERTPLLCDLCGYQTMNEIFLLLHRSQKHPVSNCSVCQFSGNSRQELTSHIFSSHPDEMPYSCSQCAFWPENQDLLDTHMKYSHNNKCDKCTFLADSSEALGFHMFESHPKKYPLLCVICSYRASIPVQLIKHELNTHYVRTYRCTHCVFHSSSVEELTQHFRKCHS